MTGATNGWISDIPIRQGSLHIPSSAYLQSDQPPLPHLRQKEDLLVIAVGVLLLIASVVTGFICLVLFDAMNWLGGENQWVLPPLALFASLTPLVSGILVLVNL